MLLGRRQGVPLVTTRGPRGSIEDSSLGERHSLRSTYRTSEWMNGATRRRANVSKKTPVPAAQVAAGSPGKSAESRTTGSQRRKICSVRPMTALVAQDSKWCARSWWCSLWSSYGIKRTAGNLSCAVNAYSSYQHQRA